MGRCCYHASPCGAGRLVVDDHDVVGGVGETADLLAPRQELGIARLLREPGVLRLPLRKHVEEGHDGSFTTQSVNSCAPSVVDAALRLALAGPATAARTVGIGAQRGAGPAAERPVARTLLRVHP